MNGSGMFAIDPERANEEALQVFALLMSGSDSPSARTEIIRIAHETQPGYARLIAEHVALLVTRHTLREAPVAAVPLITKRLGDFMFTARRVILDIHPRPPQQEVPGAD
ncbi:hypothetical protein [Microbacterium album]|uniref:Uncharacterized protein n=1 Tax=Microbacterium album TaxID=2053191 RepID=A0A917IFW6_9MICO|nr:hypothetical protein [Microbacterium album]GGH44938.1 hypothetical protein GCM10010921_19980 [Microbacterium album]